MSRFFAAVCFAVVAAACGPGAPPKTVSLRVAGGPPNATVTIDDQLIGTLDIIGAHGIALPPGKHHLTVEAPGHFPWDRTVEAVAGQAPVKLDVRLVPIPD